jgi:tripartite-type tricarboxylate transporter receptor subunit TctC
LGTSALGVATSGKSALNTFKDFQESAKKQPGVLNYSSPGTGSPQHLAMELLAQETSIKLLHVPYKGTSGALTDLMGGHVDASIVALQTAAPHLQNGSLRMLALMSPERSPAFPNVPTLKELGVANGLVWRLCSGGHTARRGGQTERRYQCAAAIAGCQRHHEQARLGRCWR